MSKLLTDIYAQSVGHRFDELIPDYTQKAYFSQILCTNLFTLLLCDHFSFAKIIHPSGNCGISRSGLNSMIITQVPLALGTIKRPL